MNYALKKALYNVIYCVAVIGIVLIVWSVAAAIVGSEFVLPDLKQTFSAI